MSKQLSKNEIQYKSRNTYLKALRLTKRYVKIFFRDSENDKTLCYFGKLESVDKEKVILLTTTHGLNRLSEDYDVQLSVVLPFTDIASISTSNLNGK